MANFGSAQGGRPRPLNAKTRAQTHIFRPPEQKVDVCARVLTSVIPGAPVATKHCDLQAPRIECTLNRALDSITPYAICTRRLYTSRPKSRRSSEKSIVSVWSAAVA